MTERPACQSTALWYNALMTSLSLKPIFESLENALLCSGSVLQRLASYKITPPANFWRDDAFLLLRDLLAHALSKEDGRLWLHEERDTEIDS